MSLLAVIKMDKRISMCAKWLEEKENPHEVLEVLRKLHPGSLNKNVGRVREVWIQNFGAGHNAGPVKIEIRQLLVLIKKRSSTAKKTKGRKGYLKQLQTAWDRVVSFGKLDLPGKWSARRAIHSRKVSFTGLADIDDLLRKVRLLPPYVSRLELTPEEKSISRIKRRESLEVKCRRGLTVHASDLIDTMESIIRYARPNYFELACALSFVSGRGLAELVANADFSPSTRGPYESEVMMGTVARVLLLCEYNHFIEGLTRLRGMKDTSCLTAAQINQRYSKSANIAARKLLPADGHRRVFGDLKVLHSAISYRVFKGHDLDLVGWVRVVVGNLSPALQRKSSVIRVEGVEDRHCRQWGDYRIREGGRIHTN